MVELLFLCKCVHTWRLPPWVLLLSLALKNSYNLKNRTHPLINKNIKHFVIIFGANHCIFFWLPTQRWISLGRRESYVHFSKTRFFGAYFFQHSSRMVAVVSEYDLCLRCNSTGVVSKRTRYLLKIHITNHYGNT